MLSKCIRYKNKVTLQCYIWLKMKHKWFFRKTLLQRLAKNEACHIVRNIWNRSCNIANLLKITNLLFVMD